MPPPRRRPSWDKGEVVSQVLGSKSQVGAFCVSELGMAILTFNF